MRAIVDKSLFIIRVPFTNVPIPTSVSPSSEVVDCGMEAPPSWLATADTLDAFLHAFERGTLAKSMWTHAAHLTVGACYALDYPKAEALVKLRSGIQALNAYHGMANTATSGYHETLTRCWLLLVRRFLRQYSLEHGAANRLVTLRAVVAAFADCRTLVQNYYSFDVVASSVARRTWIAPDRMVVGDQLLGSSNNMSQEGTV